MQNEDRFVENEDGSEKDFFPIFYFFEIGTNFDLKY